MEPCPCHRRQGPARATAPLPSAPCAASHARPGTSPAKGKQADSHCTTKPCKLVRRDHIKRASTREAEHRRGQNAVPGRHRKGTCGEDVSWMIGCAGPGYQRAASLQARGQTLPLNPMPAGASRHWGRSAPPGSARGCTPRAGRQRPPRAPPGPPQSQQHGSHPSPVRNPSV